MPAQCLRPAAVLLALAPLAFVFARDSREARRLEQVVRAEESESGRLDGLLELKYARAAANGELARAAAAGHVALGRAAEQLLEQNRDLPWFAIVLEVHFPGATPAERAALQLIRLAESQLGGLPEGERAAAGARLRAEYRAAFGYPARVWGPYMADADE